MARMNWKKARWENRIARYGKTFVQEPELPAIDPNREPAKSSPIKHKPLVLSHNQIILKTKNPSDPKRPKSTQKLVRCPSCPAQVAPNNLQKHLNKVHADLIQAHNAKTKSISVIATRAGLENLSDERPKVELLPDDHKSAVKKLTEQIQQLLFGDLLDAPHDQRVVVEVSALIRARQTHLRKIHITDEEEYTALVKILRARADANADVL